ncbi:MAG: hypothetical protein WBE61_15745 [Nitrososphaeraceae archaeon]
MKVKIKCHRCGKQRFYRGNNPYYTSCTFCRTTISIRKSKEMLKAEEVGAHIQPTAMVPTSNGTKILFIPFFLYFIIVRKSIRTFTKKFSIFGGNSTLYLVVAKKMHFFISA